MESSPEGETKEERDHVEQPTHAPQGPHNSAVISINTFPVSLLELQHHRRVKGELLYMEGRSGFGEKKNFHRGFPRNKLLFPKGLSPGESFANSMNAAASMFYTFHLFLPICFFCYFQFTLQSPGCFSLLHIRDNIYTTNRNPCI